MQTTMVFTRERDALSANVMLVALQIFNVTGMESAHARTAPLVQNVTCVVKTSSILHQRDASKYKKYIAVSFVHVDKLHFSTKQM